MLNKNVKKIEYGRSHRHRWHDIYSFASKIYVLNNSYRGVQDHIHSEFWHNGGSRKMCKIHHIEGNSSNYDQSLQTQSRTKTECNEKNVFFWEINQNIYTEVKKNKVDSKYWVYCYFYGWKSRVLQIVKIHRIYFLW